MSTFKRVIPSSQMAITRRELEDADATEIEFVSAGDGYVEVTAQMPEESVARSRYSFTAGLTSRNRFRD